MYTKKDIRYMKHIRMLKKNNKLLNRQNKEMKDNVHETINFITELIKNKK